MKKYLEYIWLDGYSTQNLRSKIKIVDESHNIPKWNFDGSSTRQASGHLSECVLNPVRTYVPNSNPNHAYILCEVLNSDMSPHESNSRSLLRGFQRKFKHDEFWWGFEQEYFITRNNIPLGFLEDNTLPQPQGRFYCAVGGNQVAGRQLVMEHLSECLDLNIDITGINAEVALGQWEYQCFAKDTLKACDDLWMSRYLLCKRAENFDCDINFSPKPVMGDCNGSGCHTNFSTNWMRDGSRGREGFENLLNRMRETHYSHIANYGDDNEKRLTGLHETQHIDTFSWGIADRGASVRIPSEVVRNNWKGYLEDRRPAANCDPYKVALSIINSTT